MSFKVACRITLAYLFAAAPEATAQGQVAERAAVFGEVIVHLAQVYNLRMDQVFVDTVSGGRAVSQQPIRSRARLIPVAQIRELA